jgi:hypothetical protein
MELLECLFDKNFMPIGIKVALTFGQRFALPINICDPQPLNDTPFPGLLTSGAYLAKQ